MGGLTFDKMVDSPHYPTLVKCTCSFGVSGAVRPGLTFETVVDSPLEASFGGVNGVNDFGSASTTKWF